MNNLVKKFSWTVAASLATMMAIACSSVDEKPAPPPAAPAPAKTANRQRAESEPRRLRPKQLMLKV